MLPFPCRIKIGKGKILNSLLLKNLWLYKVVCFTCIKESDDEGRRRTKERVRTLRRSKAVSQANLRRTHEFELYTTSVFLGLGI